MTPPADFASLLWRGFRKTEHHFQDLFHGAQILKERIPDERGNI
jgi:hypothetical protein